EPLGFPDGWHVAFAKKKSGENAEQAGGDGGEGAENPFGIPCFAVEAAGEKFVVEPVREVLPFGVGSDSESGDGNERQDSPIADEQCGAGGDERARCQVAEQQAGETVAKRDSLQHAEPADFVDWTTETAGVENTDYKKQNRAADDSANRGGPAFFFDG